MYQEIPPKANPSPQLVASPCLTTKPAGTGKRASNSKRGSFLTIQLKAKQGRKASLLLPTLCKCCIGTCSTLRGIIIVVINHLFSRAQPYTAFAQQPVCFERLARLAFSHPIFTPAKAGTYHPSQTPSLKGGAFISLSFADGRK